MFVCFPFIHVCCLVFISFVYGSCFIPSIVFISFIVFVHSLFLFIHLCFFIPLIHVCCLVFISFVYDLCFMHSCLFVFISFIHVCFFTHQNLANDTYYEPKSCVLFLGYPKLRLILKRHLFMLFVLCLFVLCLFVCCLVCVCLFLNVFVAI